MKTTLALLVALTACLDTTDPLDQTEQAVDASARVRMFSIASGTAMSSVQTAPLSTTWTGFEAVGGTQLQKLATERNLDGRLSLFTIGGDGVLYGRYQTAPGGGWNPEGWQSMGGAWIVQVLTARNFDGRIELFVRNTAGNVFHRFQVTPNGGWNPEGWLPFGGHDLGTVTAATRTDGRIEVVAVGSDNHVYHRVQFAPNSGWDADWSLLGGSNIATTTLTRTPHGLQIVALDTSGFMQGAQEDADGVWTGFSMLGSPKRMNQLVVGTTADGRLDVLAISGVATVYELAQAKIGHAWNPDFVLVGWSDVAQIALANDAARGLVAFARKTNGTIYFAGQTGGWMTDWGSLQYFGGSAQTDVVAIDQQ